MRNEPESNIIRVYVGATSLMKELLSNKQLANVLSKEELETASKIANLATKNQFLISRATLRLCIGLHYNTNVKSIDILRNRFGKPYINSMGNPTNIEFNMTHTHNLIAVGITNGIPIGIDAEYLDASKIDLNTAAEFCCPTELNTIMQLVNTKDSIYRMFAYWVSKEATLKCIGTGLSVDPREVIFTQTGTMPLETQLVRTPLKINVNQYVHHIRNPTENHIMCVCFEKREINLRIEQVELKESLITEYLTQNFI